VLEAQCRGYFEAAWNARRPAYAETLQSRKDQMNRLRQHGVEAIDD
jgi:hypothetical protein